MGRATTPDDDEPTAAKPANVEALILQCLRAFEHAQQVIRFDDIGAAQRDLRNAEGASLDQAAAQLATNADMDATSREVLGKAIAYLRDACDKFTAPPRWPDFASAFLSSREQQCRALTLLYAHRDALPIIESYFRAGSDVRRAGDNATAAAVPTGIVRVAPDKAHHEYALYVPEYYDARSKWPLIVSLHGSHGGGAEYLWTWLRPARSRGYIVLSPKSHGPTWSFMQPALDGESIIAMIDAVIDRYAIDQSRILLTGLSDGATFAYHLGLSYAARFAAFAPIAGVLNPACDGLLRAGIGKELPIHVVHGAHDMIFPVHSVRSTNALLRSLGYALKYTELPDWGHALTNSINEDIVLPWFETLGGPQV